MNLPPAIIFINSDPLTITPDGYFVDGYRVDPDGYINDLTRQTLEAQLHLDETMTLKEFNTRVEVDPNYPAIVHLQGYRVMVIVPDYHDHTNRALADIVLFYSHGLVKVEKNKYGPPGFTLPLIRLNIFDLLRDVGSRYVVILPPTATKPPRSLGGIVVDQLADSSGVHDPNPDNEYNNPDFINRK
jgi:hypothetical protein